MQSIAPAVEKTSERFGRFPGEPKTGQRVGYTKIPNTEIWTSKLNHLEFRIFVVVSAHLFGKNWAEVGDRQIAKESHLNRETVEKYVKILAEKEYWLIEKKPGIRTQYQFLPEKYFKRSLY